MGELLGTKTVLNEFIAYQAMTSAGRDLLSPGSVRITSFALCGFANFGSLAIVLGGIGGMVPERRGDLARLGHPVDHRGLAGDVPDGDDRRAVGG